MCKTLIVNDSPRMLRRLNEIVRGWDDRFQTILAASEQKAVAEVMNAATLDVAIVDLFLTNDWAPNHPEKGEGLRVLEAVREKFPSCFNILVSAKRPFVQPVRGLVDCFVSFHFSNRDYRSQLENALRHPLAHYGNTALGSR